MTYSECVFVGFVIQHPESKHDSHLWPVLLYHILQHYLINGKIYGENLLNIKCVF